jgi:thiazole/oxazole-forming peptide maturase SagD family component
MKVAVTTDPNQALAEYRRRMYSPLCGIVTSVGYSLRARGGPRVYVAGGDLCGVHALLGQRAPKAGSYHIGGSGVHPFEPEIRVYAEAAERYSSAVAVLHSDLPTRWSSFRQMMADGLPTIDARYLDVAGSSPSAHGPYDRFATDAPMTWVLAPVLAGGPEAGPGSVWLPAQLFFVGYNPRRHDGEPWLQAAVTTGTAVHTTYPRAIAAAAYEIIQVDATMGHWYGRRSELLQVVPDERTRRLDSLLARHNRRSTYELTFFYIPSPDLPDFSVACVIAERGGHAPAIAVGLGADPRLERAMYKAFLEGTGVRTLAEWGLISHRVNMAEALDPATMFDLDSNVSHYADPPHGRAVLDRFRSSPKAHASDLPADLPADLVADDDALAKHLLERFRATGKELFYRDITPPDVASVGFRAVRLYCPQTLSLCLPSAPPARHPRFAAYGGFTHSEPHPYP